ncbi:MAG TPA: hypothetical protein VHN99_04155 [Deinococcales bacterium]|nr:hypothetical protein [Deinococcales bacterium]
MRALNVVAGVLLGWVLLSNLSRFWYPVTLALWPFGLFTIPALAVGLLAVAVTALVYALWHSLTVSRQRSRHITDLRRLDEVTRALQAQEESRLAALERQILNRFDQLDARLSAPTGAAGTPEALDPLMLRVERVRDEISADIGQLEDTILRALDRPQPL